MMKVQLAILLLCIAVVFSATTASALADKTEYDELMQRVRLHEAIALDVARQRTVDQKRVGMLREGQKKLEDKAEAMCSAPAEEHYRLQKMLREAKERAKGHNQAANNPSKPHSRVQHERATQINLGRMQEIERQLGEVNELQNVCKGAKEVLSAVALLLSEPSSMEGDL